MGDLLGKKKKPIGKRPHEGSERKVLSRSLIIQPKTQPLAVATGVLAPRQEKKSSANAAREEDRRARGLGQRKLEAAEKKGAPEPFPS